MKNMDYGFAEYYYRVFIVLMELKRYREAYETISFMIENCGVSIFKMENHLDVFTSAVLLKLVFKGYQ